MAIYRIDSNNKVAKGSPGRILLSRIESSGLFSSGKELVPKEIPHADGKSELIEEVVRVEKEKGQSARPIGIYFEGARTNGHGIVAPTDEFVIDLMIANMRYKMPISTVRIKYNLDSVVCPASSTRKGIFFIIGCMMNLYNSAELKISRLPESATTLRSSLLPAIEASFTSDQSAYVAKKLSFADYSKFIDYVELTKDGDYAKDK